MSRANAFLAKRLSRRNEVSRRFFAAESERLARACRDMARRFSRGGRLFAFGLGNAITDAQHVAVEFVHPVIVGKRALPARDVSSRYCAYLAALVAADDIVMGFDFRGTDPDVARALAAVQSRGAQTFALAGDVADYAFRVIDEDPFVHQEIVELLYHTLWESVHVFLDHHTALGHDAGAAGFLYPFLGAGEHGTDALVADVANSIRSKALEGERLGELTAEQQGDNIVALAGALQERLAAGGKLLMLGNGGSATDATDWALDCIDSPKRSKPIAALSLADETATMTAVANDVGQESTFTRQLIAHSRTADAAIAITTSGNSANIVAALIEARRRGLLTVALTGGDGGEIVRRGLADYTIVVPSDYIPRIQEVHASIYHVVTDMISLAEAIEHEDAHDSTGL
jgi:D-sedoheptulose 7-phosphate isomerase